MKTLWIIYPFCSIFILVGASIAFFALRGIFKAREIKDWPKVDAQVTACDFNTNSDSEGSTYHVTVNYVYSVRGHQYSNNKIHPSYVSSNLGGHRELYESLQKCSIVKARYNELNPAESYIVTGYFSSSLTILFGGLLFFSMGLLFLLIFHFAIVGNSNYAAGLEVVEQKQAIGD